MIIVKSRDLSQHSNQVRYYKKREPKLNLRLFMLKNLSLGLFLPYP